jgi:hypothetical protein
MSITWWWEEMNTVTSGIVFAKTASIWETFAAVLAFVGPFGYIIHDRFILWQTTARGQLILTLICGS